MQSPSMYEEAYEICFRPDRVWHPTVCMFCVILGMQTDLNLTQLTPLRVCGSGLISAKLVSNWKGRIEFTGFCFLVALRNQNLDVVVAPGNGGY